MPAKCQYTSIHLYTSMACKPAYGSVLHFQLIYFLWGKKQKSYAHHHARQEPMLKTNNHTQKCAWKYAMAYAATTNIYQFILFSKSYS